MFLCPLYPAAGSVIVVPYLNKFQQVSSDDHQLPLAGLSRSDVQGWSAGIPHLTWPCGGTLSCDLSHDTFDVNYPLHLYEQTNACANITFTQLR